MRHPGVRLSGFARRLQAVVDTHGNIQNLAKITGVSPKTIGDWLREVRIPHSATLSRFAPKAGTTAQWLIYGDGEEAPSFTIDQIAPPERALWLSSLDGRESLAAVSIPWAESWFSLERGEGLMLVHASVPLPPDVVAAEPVLVRDLAGRMPYIVRPGEILLVALDDETWRVRRADAEGKHEGRLIGTAVWTGHRLNSFPRKKP